ncbi:hypothetical protein Tco_0199012 [Tanacetum coccineum]
MHNNIMAAGLRDRPPMLATGRYTQWQSCFLRYIDTRPNGDALKKGILEGPYTPSTVIIPAVPATKNSLTVPERTTVETILNMKPKRVKDSRYHKEKMLLCKQAGKGVQLQAEQSDWLADTDEEIDKKELEAHYSYMAKIQEVPTTDSGTDSDPLEQNDQNAVECDDERVALANLIANLKLDVDENKKIQKQLKKANTTLSYELTECKSILAKTSRTLGEI